MKTPIKYFLLIAVAAFGLWKFYVEQKTHVDKITSLQTELEQSKTENEKLKLSIKSLSVAKEKTYYPNGQLQSEKDLTVSVDTQIETERQLQEMMKAKSSLVVAEITRKDRLVSLWLTFGSFADIAAMRPDGFGGSYQHRLIGEWFAGAGAERRKDESVTKATTSFMF